MTSAIVPQKNISILPSEVEFAQLQQASKIAASCQFYKAHGGYENIFMIGLAARELGIPLTQALNSGIWNIQGKIEISARLLNSLIRRNGHSIRVIEQNADRCVLEGVRYDNGDRCTAGFSVEDAKVAGLMGKATWRAHLEDMLWARAISRLARRLFPDVVGTAYVEGEIRDSRTTKGPLMGEIEVFDETWSTAEIAQKEVRLYQSIDECDRLLAQEYIQKYSAHWEKPLEQTLKDYEDLDKFKKAFYKWKAKHLSCAKKPEICA